MSTVQSRAAVLPAVVVAYHGGADMLEVLRERGIPFVRIQTDPDVSANRFMTRFLTDTPRDHEVLVYRGDVVRLANELRALGVTHVIPADEAGVKLTDLLCDELGLPFNGMARSAARRNKRLMHEAVAERGLRVPLQRLCGSPADVDAWMEEHRLAFPVVVKPLDGAGSAGVTRCDSPDDVRQAFATIRQLALHQGNVISVEDEVLAQELLRGTEYVVDTVSLDGHHKVTDIWKCVKGAHNGSAFVYEYFDLLPRDGATQDALAAYVPGVLDALDISLGPGHAEVYFHDETGPVLVEVGSRIGGPRMPYPTAACTASGKSQMEYTVDAYLEPERFHDRWDDGYDIVRQARMVFLISEREALLDDFDAEALDEIRSLPSYHAEEMALEPGERMVETVDVRSSPGCIFLVHESTEQLVRDYDAIRALEPRLYRAQAPTSTPARPHA